MGRGGPAPAGMHMDDDSAKATTPRRTPAQKAAQAAGLPPGVFLHEDAMGGFTASGRKPKRLKPGDLSQQPRKRRKALAPPPEQKALQLPDDDVVVIPSMPAPKGALVLTDEHDVDAEEERFPLSSEGAPEDAARAAIAEALFNEVGAPSSLLATPTGVSFAVRPGLGEGQAHTRRRVAVPLPGGNSTGHVCDVALELDGGALLVLDVLSSQSPLAQVKAHAFDALQLRGVSQCYAVLVFVEEAGGLGRDHVEAIAHGYDHFYGISGEAAKEPARYTALRSRVAQWIKAASKR